MRYALIYCFIFAMMFILTYSNLESTEIDEFIENTMAEYYIPGASVCVVNSSGVILSANYGFAEIDSDSEKTDASLFPIASVSKTFVGVAVMQLVEQGIIDLDSDINNYLPFEISHPFSNEVISLRMLMAHVSSISDNDMFAFASYSVINDDCQYPLGEFLENYLTESGIDYSPGNFGQVIGSNFEYSNVGIALAAFVVEYMTQITFEEYCHINIFNPLQMEHSSFYLSSIDTNNLVTPYCFDFANDEYEPNDHIGFVIYPAMGLKTSSLQLANYLMMMINEGEFAGESILSNFSIDQTTQTQYPEIEEFGNMKWGLSWAVEEVNNKSYWGHLGSFSGSKACIQYNKNDDVGVIVLINGDSEEGIGIIKNRLIEYADQSTAVSPGSDNYSMQVATINYPNPFNPSTTISFSLNTDSTSLRQGYAGQAENTEIEIYNLRGQRIKSILIPSSSHSPVTSITWNGDDDFGKPVSSGIYYYKLIVNGKTEAVKKCLLLK